MTKKVFKCPDCGEMNFIIEVVEETIYDCTVNLDYHICTSCGREISPSEYNLTVFNMEIN